MDFLLAFLALAMIMVCFGRSSALLWLEDDVLSRRGGITIGANSRSYALTYLPELLYVSTTVLLVLVPTYVRPTYRKWTKTTGHQPGQNGAMSCHVGPAFSELSWTCHPTRHLGPKIGDSDIRQTQLRPPCGGGGGGGDESNKTAAIAT